MNLCHHPGQSKRRAGRLTPKHMKTYTRYLSRLSSKVRRGCKTANKGGHNDSGWRTRFEGALSTLLAVLSPRHPRIALTMMRPPLFGVRLAYRAHVRLTRYTPCGARDLDRRAKDLPDRTDCDTVRRGRRQKHTSTPNTLQVHCDIYYDRSGYHACGTHTA